MGAKWAREVFHACLPLRYDFCKCVIIDETYIKAFTAMFDDITDGEILVGLVQVVACPRPETLPRSGIFIEFNMNPEDWFVIFGDAAIIQEILLNQLAVVVLFFHFDCFLIFVINETNEHNDEVGNRQFQDFVFEHCCLIISMA